MSRPAPEPRGRIPAGPAARRPRRAQRPATGGPVEDAGASGRSLDDGDAGWNAQPVPSTDEELWRRERPPHWS